MKIEDKNGIKYSLNLKKLTAVVIKSPNVCQYPFIPHFVQHGDQSFKVISIGPNAFNDMTIVSLTFDPDSEVKKFKNESFSGCYIEKLQIPASLQIIENGAFFQTEGLSNIEVSPQNQYFSFYDSKYLIGKSKKSQKNFDLLIYARFDLTTAIIPSFIKVLKEHSINTRLEYLIFPDDTEIERIEYGSISENLVKLRIPKTLKKIDQFCFQISNNLTQIEVSPENETFSYIDDKYLLKKRKNGKFEKIAFCRRDIVDVKIPRYITKIGSNAFSKCEKIESIQFESNSMLQLIGTDAFSWTTGPKTIIFPEKVNCLKSSAFCRMLNLSFVEFLGDEITVDFGCFHLCADIQFISFPNVTCLSFWDLTFDNVSIYVNPNAKLYCRRK